MNPSTKPKTLALFFTRGVSLQKWDAVGNLSREIKLYNHLANHFEQIYFFTYGDERDLRYKNQLAENITVIPKRWNVPSLVYMFLLPFANRKLLKKIDVYKTNQAKGGLAALIAKKRFGKPLVVRCGYEWLLASTMKGVSRARLMLIKHIERKLYRGANRIIVSAVNIRDFITKTFSTAPETITVIPNYIDTDLFHPKDTTKTPGSICFIGRLSDQKNLFNLVSALEGTSLQLSIYGSGELEEALREHAHNLQVAVEFKGRIPNEQLPDHLNTYETFVLPSLYEGNPKVLLEAMSCGLPVVATNVIGNQEVIAHRENGLLCETDPESIKEALLRLHENPDLRRALGRHARTTIEQHFSLERIIDLEMEIHTNV